MKIRNRKDVPEEYKWKLEDIFPSDDAWEECFFALSERMGKIVSYKGRLSDEDALYECLILSTSLSHDLSRLYQYARMRRDEDAREPLYQGMTDRADALAVRLSSLSSFVTPELAAMSTDVLKALAAKKRFADYSVMLGEIVRNKEIILSDKEGETSARGGDIRGHQRRSVLHVRQRGHKVRAGHRRQGQKGGDEPRQPIRCCCRTLRRR